MLQIAASKCVVQWGFDETNIDGVSWYTLTLTLTLNLTLTLTHTRTRTLSLTLTIL
jgi:hypothetical protein